MKRTIIIDGKEYEFEKEAYCAQPFRMNGDVLLTQCSGEEADVTARELVDVLLIEVFGLRSGVSESDLLAAALCANAAYGLGLPVVPLAEQALTASICGRWATLDCSR